MRRNNWHSLGHISKASIHKSSFLNHQSDVIIFPVYILKTTVACTTDLYQSK